MIKIEINRLEGTLYIQVPSDDGKTCVDKMPLKEDELVEILEHCHDPSDSNIRVIHSFV